MGEVVMILGKSGTGKSTSLRNLDKKNTAIIEVMGKRLPFKDGKDFQVMNLQVTSDGKKRWAGDMYNTLNEILKSNDRNCYVIDDSTYLMQLENFERCRENGYSKFTEMALHFEELITTAKATNEDTVVYFLHHISTNDNGGQCEKKPQTAGKMIETAFNIEGVCNVILESDVRDGKYGFITNKTSTDGIAKTPMGMFEEEFIDNDLAVVDKTIREYFGMKGSDGK